MRFWIILIGVYVLYYFCNIMYDLTVKKQKNVLNQKNFVLVDEVVDEVPIDVKVQQDEVPIEDEIPIEEKVQFEQEEQELEALQNEIDNETFDLTTDAELDHEMYHQLTDLSDLSTTTEGQHLDINNLLKQGLLEGKLLFDSVNFE